MNETSQTLAELRDLLHGTRLVSAWKVHERTVESVELFFVRRELEMHRVREVRRIDLTLYQDFQEDGVRCRGAFNARIHPTMSGRELRAAVERGAEAARFVLTPWYPLVTPELVRSRTGRGRGVPKRGPAPPLAEAVEPVTRSIFAEDRQADGGIASAELFLERATHRLVNSEGLEVSWRRDGGLFELITQWRGPREETELRDEVRFSGLPTDGALGPLVREQLAACRDRALAEPAPPLDNPEVLLVGEPVRELLGVYRVRTSAESVYKKLSTAEVGQAIQGEPVEGDLIDLALDPFLPGSPHSAPYDGDGFPLSPVPVLERGRVRTLWGSLRFCSYLGLEPTGEIGNFVVAPGSRPLEELRGRARLELHYFSDFQCDPTSGDFAGEVRLGYLLDGGRRRPVTGGSLGGNLQDVQGRLLLSREVRQREGFRGPRAALLGGASWSGG